MKTVVLIGAGHAHLEVLKGLSIEEIAKHRFVLISPSRITYYSGLIPRFIAGEIEVSDLAISSADFAESKGFKFIQDEVRSVDQINKSVKLKSGEEIFFDLLSINTGGTPNLIPSEESLNILYLRPFEKFVPKWREIQRIFCTIDNPRFVVVGGGAAAVEVAACVKMRLEKNQTKNCEVHLVSKSSRLCENYTDKISEQIRQSLLKSGIEIHLNEPVSQIHQNTIKLRHGRNLRFDSALIVTPTQPSKTFSRKVDSRLQLSSCVFAAGDGTQMVNYPSLPRSGAIAVRQGRHLVHNIRKTLLDLEPSEFKIKLNPLNILNTGDNSARLVWGNFSFEGKWPLRIKNWIDQRYMLSFEVSK
jgi:NADH dehydrogenase FAD-containing subunit